MANDRTRAQAATCPQLLRAILTTVRSRLRPDTERRPASLLARQASSVGPPDLSLSTKIGYTFFRMPLSALDFTVRPARQAVWVDTLRQPLSVQASLISGVKSLDLLLGFTIGKLSDQMRTRWGRRKPFIAILFPIALVCMLLFVNAPAFGLRPAISEGRSTPCAELVGVATCDELKACLEDAIWNGRIEAHDATVPLHPEQEARSPFGLNAYFAIFYFLWYFCAATGSQIPYDALGMELTSSYDERSSLFGVKTLFQFLGYAAAPIVSLALASAFAHDLAALYSALSVVFALLGLAAYVVLLRCVSERPPPAAPPVEVPFIPSARRVLNNRPYCTYLLMKVPLTCFSLIPSNLAAYFVKHNMALESWLPLYNIVLLFALAGGLIATPLLVAAARRYGKREVLTRVLLFEGVFYVLAGLVPGSVYAASPMLLLPIGACIGVGQVIAFVLPDAMLADIIDYAELHSGSRDEGMYTVVETNLQQFVEIAGGVVPLIFLSASGYQALGGCKCGCGVSCEAAIGEPYSRWHCPGSVGYSCTGAIGETLFFEPEPEVPPCAAQSDSVQHIISFFFLVLPGVLALLAAWPASRMPITAARHAKMIEIIERRGAAAASKGGATDAEAAAADGQAEVDPLTGEYIVLPPNTPQSLLAEHFSRDEWRMGGTIAGMRKMLMARLLWWVSIVAGILLLISLVGTPNVVTCGCLALSGLFILIPWDAARLRSLRGDAAGGHERARRGAPASPDGVVLATSTQATTFVQPSD